MCVNNLSRVALDSAAAGIQPAISGISSRKSNALTMTPRSHTGKEWQSEHQRRRRATAATSASAAHDKTDGVVASCHGDDVTE